MICCLSVCVQRTEEKREDGIDGWMRGRREGKKDKTDVKMWIWNITPRYTRYRGWMHVLYR